MKKRLRLGTDEKEGGKEPSKSANEISKVLGEAKTRFEIKEREGFS